MNESNLKKHRPSSPFFGRARPHLDLSGRIVSHHAPNMRCTYSVEFRPGFICLVDHDIGRSVTNTAHEVIVDLVHLGHDVIGSRVIYRDTAGTWDELLVVDGRFTGFKSIDCKDLDAAITKATAREPDPD